MKPAVLLSAAERDLLERTEHSANVCGDVLAGRFIETSFAAIRAIEKMPGIGASHIAELCDVPGLREWRVKGFPVHLFYFERAEHVDVVRLLADAQNLAAPLGMPTDE